MCIDNKERKKEEIKGYIFRERGRHIERMGDIYGDRDK
jgi:hypothetical protein